MAVIRIHIQIDYMLCYGGYQQKAYLVFASSIHTKTKSLTHDENPFHSFCVYDIYGTDGEQKIRSHQKKRIQNILPIFVGCCVKLIE